MTDLFSYLLPYPASVLRLDSDPKLNFLVSLLVLLISWMSYVDTLIWFYSNWYLNRIGKEESKI